MANELSTAGVSLSYGVSVDRPTAASAYTLMASIKSVPDINPEPEGLETTDLSQTEWKTYIKGLKDPGGALAFKANNTEDFQDDWDDLYDAYVAGKALNPPKETYFCIQVPELANAFYFKGAPSPLGLSAIDVSNVLEIDAYITPTQIIGWAVKPTV